TGSAATATPQAAKASPPKQVKPKGPPSLVVLPPGSDMGSDREHLVVSVIPIYKTHPQDPKYKTRSRLSCRVRKETKRIRILRTAAPETRKATQPTDKYSRMDYLMGGYDSQDPRKSANRNVLGEYCLICVNRSGLDICPEWMGTVETLPPPKPVYALPPPTIPKYVYPPTPSGYACFAPGQPMPERYCKERYYEIHVIPAWPQPKTGKYRKDNSAMVKVMAFNGDKWQDMCTQMGEEICLQGLRQPVYDCVSVAGFRVDEDWKDKVELNVTKTQSLPLKGLDAKRLLQFWRYVMVGQRMSIVVHCEAKPVPVLVVPKTPTKGAAGDTAARMAQPKVSVRDFMQSSPPKVATIPIPTYRTRMAQGEKRYFMHDGERWQAIICSQCGGLFPSTNSRTKKCFRCYAMGGGLRSGGLRVGDIPIGSLEEREILRKMTQVASGTAVTSPPKYSRYGY
ncbi:hypothetical protein KIPB_005976, partial [Kipferlia bialata]